MKLISLNLMANDLEAMERLVNAKLYPNVSECIREAIRNLLHDEADYAKRFMEES